MGLDLWFREELGICEHRTVKDGRIICTKVVEGEAKVSPNTCRICPARAVNCIHLRFSLAQAEPHPHRITEVGDDEPPQLRFEHATCALKILPLDHPKQCAGCALRERPLRPAATGTDGNNGHGAGLATRLRSHLQRIK